MNRFFSESQIQDEPKFKTADDLINAIQPYLNSDMVAEFGSTYQFNLTGENGGKYYLDVKNGSVNLLLFSIFFKKGFSMLVTCFSSYC